MKRDTAAQAEITRKIVALPQEIGERTFWEPPSISVLSPRSAEPVAGGQGGADFERNDTQWTGRAADSRAMARPPPGACANRLAPGR